MEKFDDAQLVELVRQFGCIWDKRSPLYQNKIVKENAWLSISVIMTATVEACQTRWLVLRQRYTKEKRNKIPSGSGAETAHWSLYASLKFLNEVIQPRKTSGNIPAPLTSPSSPGSSCSPWDSFDEIAGESPVPSPHNAHSQAIGTTLNTGQKRRPTTLLENPSSKKKTVNQATDNYL
ncbi:hypothetical protein ABEB36_014767 [Hypothenemus hampei]|uniref:MADF domain-containing protein n=1 Tax=Hypothenemus hampei TaxID=57062 RepID=A0ABD1E2T8_HYPHA